MATYTHKPSLLPHCVYFEMITALLLFLLMTFQHDFSTEEWTKDGMSLHQVHFWQWRTREQIQVPALTDVRLVDSFEGEGVNKGFQWRI